MKIFRGPRSTDKWKQTDSKNLTEWSNEWRPGNKVLFDGTIDKAGERHTDLGIELEKQDIIALHDALVRYERDRTQLLEKRNEELIKTVGILEDALEKIDSLLSIHADKAPTSADVIATVEKIANHFRWDFSRGKPLELGWIKYESL